MALSDFVNRNIERLDVAMAALGHNTMMGNQGVDEGVLIAMGRYRQMKSERDHWLAMKKKRTVDESRLEEMPDDDGETAAPEAEEPKRRTVLRRARSWGGQ